MLGGASRAKALRVRYPLALGGLSANCHWQLTEPLRLCLSFTPLGCGAPHGVLVPFHIDFVLRAGQVGSGLLCLEPEQLTQADTGGMITLFKLDRLMCRPPLARRKAETPQGAGSQRRSRGSAQQQTPVIFGQSVQTPQHFSHSQQRVTKTADIPPMHLEHRLCADVEGSSGLQEILLPSETSGGSSSSWSPSSIVMSLQCVLSLRQAISFGSVLRAHCTGCLH